MTGRWMLAVEIAADTLGQMLIEIAEGGTEHGNEDIAAAVLRAGLAALLGEEPEADRLEEVGQALYGKLHDGDDAVWADLSGVERGFWIDIARAAACAADAWLLESAGRTSAA